MLDEDKTNIEFNALMSKFTNEIESYSDQIINFNYNNVSVRNKWPKLNYNLNVSFA